MSQGLQSTRNVIVRFYNFKTFTVDLRSAVIDGITELATKKQKNKPRIYCYRYNMMELAVI